MNQYAEAGARPTVSVMMPVYNGSRYLQEAIDSMLAQTFSDWELLVIDDGSTDDTPQILAGCRDPRIKITRQKNSGEPAARNTALRQARGKYVAFLDHDDLYLPNALADMTAYLDEHPEYSVIFSNGWMVDQNGRRLVELSQVRPGIYTGDVLEQIVLDNGILTVPVCVMIRRQAVLECQLEFDEEMNYSTDWDFWIRMARFVQFGYLDRLTCLYRIHETNMTRVQSVHRRKSSQTHGRMKVLNSDWFDNLSMGTRQRFFQEFLISYSTGEPEIQEAILENPHTKKMPDPFRASLYRLAGSMLFDDPRYAAKAGEFLKKSLEISPHDRKSQLLYRLSQMPRPIIKAVIGVYRMAHHAAQWVKGFGKRKSAPVPAQLRRAAGQ